MTVVVNTAPVATAVATTVVVTGASFPHSVVGMKGKMKHAMLAKDNIDETRKTPGAHTPVRRSSSAVLYIYRSLPAYPTYMYHTAGAWHART
jgi:hypothetical protein